MSAARLDLPHAPPEWRHNAPYLAIALLMHAVVLVWPQPARIAVPATPSPPPLMARLVESVPHRPVAPAPITPASPKPSRELPAPTPRSVIATPSAPTSPPPTFTVPAAVATPPVAPLTAPPVTAPPAPPALAVTTARFDAAYLNNPEPNYPSASRRLGEEGKVLLRVRVTAAGLPAAVDIEKSSRFERLDEAARQAVARWRFVPARRGDEAVESSVIVPIVFRLSE